MSARDMIREFHLAFGRQVNETLTTPSVSERVLRANLLLEEVIEHITKGLGVDIIDKDGGNLLAGWCPTDKVFFNHLTVEHKEGRVYDPIETADGLADVCVIAHGTAHVLGMNLDTIFEEVHASNMSKLNHDGTPIINGETPGYRDRACLAENNIGEGWADDEEGFRPDLPIGKIIKGPNFREPDIASILKVNMFVHIDESDIKPSAQLDHCSEHPDQTTANCTGGYGLAGGGVGMYYICNTCGGIFGKTDDGDDFG